MICWLHVLVEKKFAEMKATSTSDVVKNELRMSSLDEYEETRQEDCKRIAEFIHQPGMAQMFHMSEMMGGFENFV